MTNEPEPNPRAGEALKPCPFCGGEAVVEQQGTARCSHIIACTDCGARLETGEVWNAGSSWNTRPLPQPSEFGTAWQSAVEETDMLERELDLTKVDHVALWLEANAISPPLTHQLGWVACRITEAYEAQIAKLQADGDKLAEALEAFQRHYDLNDCDERCGALEVPISDLRRATQALAAKGDSRG